MVIWITNNGSDENEPVKNVKINKTVLKRDILILKSINFFQFQKDIFFPLIPRFDAIFALTNQQQKSCPAATAVYLFSLWWIA